MKIPKFYREKIKAYAYERHGDRYRIDKDDRVLIYGPIPHSIETGWWFAGYWDELIAQFKMEGRSP